MAFPSVPSFSRQEIDEAGDALISDGASNDELHSAQEILKRWRACHAYPINTFQSTLRDKVEKYSSPIVAQRLKRSPTIITKLKRFNWLKLSEMQDIGGVRGVVGSIKDVRDLESRYLNGRFTHELYKTSDYISEPKSDGYRGIHLIYRYHQKGRSGEPWNGLLTEMQLRTKLQHSWATAVETIDTIFDQSLKLGGGKKEWRDFFSVTSSAFAHLEEENLVPGYEELSRSVTFEKVAMFERKLHVIDRMRGLSAALRTIHGQGSKSWSYHLIVLNPGQSTVTINSYPRGAVNQASDAYASAEARASAGEKIDPVLVSAGRTEDLRRAYPNYFLDVRDFTTTLNGIVAESK